MPVARAGTWGRNQSHLPSCLKVLNEQGSNELGRLDLRKVSDRRRVVQHIDAGERDLVPNTNQWPVAYGGR
jgi:hypothetical protein